MPESKKKTEDDKKIKEKEVSVKSIKQSMLQISRKYLMKFKEFYVTWVYIYQIHILKFFTEMTFFARGTASGG